MLRTVALAVAFAVLAAASARAQPPVAPLAQLHDEQLDEMLVKITRDPALRVDEDQRVRALGLLTEGVRRLQIASYEQALADLLAAYALLPSPEILVTIASTLQDLGRLADTANTYARYLAALPASPDRSAEVKARLVELDAQLAILVVDVSPRGSEISIDGGPFITVGGSLQLRVRPGAHTIRIRRDAATTQLDVSAFAAETKRVAASLAGSTAGPAAPEHVDGWLIDRRYATTDGNSRERRVLDLRSGVELTSDVPHRPPSDDQLVPIAVDVAPGATIGSGVFALARIDGNHLRGFAGGIGVVYAASDPIELELAGLKSEVWGAYGGARYRFMTGSFRPYAAAGLPVFFFEADNGESHVGIGIRIAAGAELELRDHLSVEADLGIEHFFNVGDVVYNMSTFDATVFAPTLGVIGRL